MSDAPVTQAAFEAFQVELFSHLAEIDHQLQAFDSTESRYYDVFGRLETIDQRMFRLEDDFVAIRTALSRIGGSGSRLEERVMGVESTGLRLDNGVERLKEGQRDVVAAVQRLEQRTTRGERESRH